MQKSEETLKAIVRQKYAEIVSGTKDGSCCGCGPEENCGTPEDYSVFSDDYTSLEGYVEDADLQLGCGLPVEFAKIKKGDIVVDLGSGAGNDVFIARTETGAEGKVIGIDMTPEMIAKARENAEKLGFVNVEFFLGEIEKMPLSDATADVVISNCVLNLVPNKKAAFVETYRILKSGGHFSISDVVLKGDLPEALREEAEMYAGCVSGAIQKEDYLEIIKQTGFKNIQLQKEKEVVLPDSILGKYLTKEQIDLYRTSNLGIYSITVFAEK